MTMPLDMHGQPLNPSLNRTRRTERDLSELLGVAKGMLADGVVNEAEAEYLARWGTNHPDALQHWPTNLIFTRLQQYFADGRIDEMERGELYEVLTCLVGGTASLLLGYEAATTLPLDVPPPAVVWPNETYVFTGRFAYGSRGVCERAVCDRGGSCERTITRRTGFLVIGTFGSEDWRHSAYGEKIQRAVELRSKGAAVRIIGEDHWASAL